MILDLFGNSVSCEQVQYINIMAKAVFFNLLLIIICNIAFSQDSTVDIMDKEQYRLLINTIIEAVKNGNKDKVADLIHYPLYREYPLPPIYDKQDMIAKFDQVFDKELTESIGNSSFETDWDIVGWRGIMLDNGLVWVSYSGKIAKIGWISAQEEEVRNRIILDMKNNIHESLRYFEEPILVAETENHIIRIDLLHDYNYRFALWAPGKEQSEIPNITLENGSRVPDGSIGNHWYKFIYGNHQYILYVSIDDDKYYGEFVIYNGENMLWFEDVENILLNENVVRIEK